MLIDCMMSHGLGWVGVRARRQLLGNIASSNDTSNYMAEAVKGIKELAKHF